MEIKWPVAITGIPTMKRGWAIWPSDHCRINCDHYEEKDRILDKRLVKIKRLISQWPYCHHMKTDGPMPINGCDIWEDKYQNHLKLTEEYKKNHVNPIHAELF